MRHVVRAWFGIIIVVLCGGCGGGGGSMPSPGLGASPESRPDTRAIHPFHLLLTNPDSSLPPQATVGFLYTECRLTITLHWDRGPKLTLL